MGGTDKISKSLYLVFVVEKLKSPSFLKVLLIVVQIQGISMGA